MSGRCTKMKSKYVITVHNKDSLEYGTSSYHFGIGTGTIVCYNKDTAIFALGRYIAMHKNVDHATISSFDSNGKSLGTCFWYRSNGGTDAQHLLQFLR